MANSDSERKTRGIRVWFYEHPRAQRILWVILMLAIGLGSLYLLAVMCGSAGCPYSAPWP